MKLEDYTNLAGSLYSHCTANGVGEGEAVKGQSLARQLRQAAWRPELRAEAAALAVRFEVVAGFYGELPEHEGGRVPAAEFARRVQ